MDINRSEINRKTFIFQNKKYSGDKINSYIEKHRDKSPLEIFPGITVSLKEENKFKKIISRFLYGKDNTKLIFDVQNARDWFNVIDSKTPNDYSSSQKFETTTEYIHPNDVLYPNYLSEGKCHGCPVTDYFSRLSSPETYDIISDSDIVEQTKAEPYFINLCKSSRCHKTYQNILTEGYKINKNDMIKLDKYNDSYIPQEGKHRICALKRFDYPKKIPAEITHSTDYKADTLQEEHFVSFEQRLKKYYECFKYYGLSKEEVLAYLSDTQMSLCKIIIEKNALNEQI